MDFSDNYGGEKITEEKNWVERGMYGEEKIHVSCTVLSRQKQLEFDNIIDFAFPAGSSPMAHGLLVGGRRICLKASWLAGWLVAGWLRWLAFWVVCWLVGWLAGRLAGCEP